jgi:hypothetical protein
MKNGFLLLICCLFLSCSNDDGDPNCNFLFDAGVNLTVDTNLPQFSQLQFPGNGRYVSGQGNNGIWLWRATSSSLLAWDAADPTHPPSACSTLNEINTGDIVECGCEDGNQFSLITGQAIGQNTEPCTLLPYRVDDLGNGVFLVTN